MLVFSTLGTQTSNPMISTGFASKRQSMARTTLMPATLLEQMPTHIKIESQGSWTYRLKFPKIPKTQIIIQETRQGLQTSISMPLRDLCQVLAPIIFK